MKTVIFQIFFELMAMASDPDGRRCKLMFYDEGVLTGSSGYIYPNFFTAGSFGLIRYALNNKKTSWPECGFDREFA